MNLESVRDLKREVLATQVLPLSRPEARARRAIETGQVDRPDQQLPTIAVGIAKVADRDFKLAVRVQGSTAADNALLQRIRTLAADEVDIRFVGRIVKRASWHRERQRPLLIGSSIGHHGHDDAGTLGCFVTARGDGTSRILSNNHVLARENTAAAGDDIVQQSRRDGGSAPAHVVGTLDRFVPLETIGVNHADCALATILPTIAIDRTTLTDFGKLQGLAEPPHNTGVRVAKLGRTTGLTNGSVTAFDLDNVVADYDIGTLRFDDQIEVEGNGTQAFSRGGDSGAIVVDDDGRAVGLLFSGTELGGSNDMGLTYVNPIRTVLTALGVDLLI